MSLNYKKFGAGHPLIILHGLFGMLDNWQTLAKQFAESFEVYIVDQRNHGKSPHLDEFSYYVLAQDVYEFMQEHQIESAYILGHSMGGKTAMQLATDYAEKVDKLIVVDIAPKDYPAGHDEIFKAFYAVDLEKLENRKQADAKLAETLDEFGVRQFLLKNLDRTKTGYRWKANLDVIRDNYDNIILNSLGPFQQYDAPTLFIKGGASERYIELDDLPVILDYFPNAKLEIVEDAGHWVHAEKPKELFDLVMGFLNE